MTTKKEDYLAERRNLVRDLAQAFVAKGVPDKEIAVRAICLADDILNGLAMLKPEGP